MDGHEHFTEQEHDERMAYLDSTRIEEETNLMDAYFNQVIEVECVHPFCLALGQGSAAYLETRGWNLRRPVKCGQHNPSRCQICRMPGSTINFEGIETCEKCQPERLFPMAA